MMSVKMLAAALIAPVLILSALGLTVAAIVHCLPI